MRGRGAEPDVAAPGMAAAGPTSPVRVAGRAPAPSPCTSIVAGCAGVGVIPGTPSSCEWIGQYATGAVPGAYDST